MKVVHVFPWSNELSREWVQYVARYFSQNMNLILVYEQPPADSINVANYLRSCQNVKLIGPAKKNFLRGFDPWVKEQLVAADSIVLHYASFYALLALARVPGLIKKTRVVCWGGDIEVLKTRCSRGKKGIKLFIQKQIVKWFLTKVEQVGFLINEDMTWVREIVPKMRKTSVVCYIISKYAERQESIFKGEKGKGKTRILLGNSATESNNHFEIIEKLAQYPDEYVLYVPLSYGDKEYAKKVIRFGKELIGDRFVPVEQFMELDDYVKFLSSMDIAIFNHHRQQGLGNLGIAFQGKDKVYLSKNSPCWKHYEDAGYVFFDVEQIGKIPFEEFREVSSDALERNQQLMLQEDEAYQKNIESWKRFMGM